MCIRDSLTSSFSYDTMIIGLAMAFTAQMFYLIYGNTLPQKKDYVFALVLLVLLAPCKLVYIVSVSYTHLDVYKRQHRRWTA